jgi:hypothetical protein
VRKIKEVLRLKFEVGLGLRQIARGCSIVLGTAHEYLQRAEAAKITWPLGADWDDDRLEAGLFGGPPRARPTVLPMPDATLRELLPFYGTLGKSRRTPSWLVLRSETIPSNRVRRIFCRSCSQ